MNEPKPSNLDSEPETPQDDLGGATGQTEGRSSIVEGVAPAKTVRKLTLLQQKFCSEYVRDMNGTQAAIRAGYSAKTAAAAASRLLTDVKIQEALTGFQRELAASLRITPEKVLGEWAEIAFGNVDDFIDRAGRIDLNKPSRAQMGTISEIQTETYSEGHGENAEPVKRVKLKFHSKVQALDALSKHLGLFERDNEQKGLGAFMEFLSGVAGGTNRTDS